MIRSFSTPRADERAGRALDLLERQDLVLGQERVVAPEDLLRHAIRAAEVAAVGDRDAQVVQRPAQAIERLGSGESGLEGVHRAPIVRAELRCTSTTARGTGAPAVPPAYTAGTTSGLHRTKPRWHDAATPRTRLAYPDEDPRMATTDAKTGFRLPWSTDRTESDEHG